MTRKDRGTPASDDGGEELRTAPIRIAPVTTEGEPVPVLVVLAGPQMGKVIRLGARPVRVGRADDADLSLPDTAISRYHSEFHLLAPHVCEVRDLGSTNGTFVEGRRVEQTRIFPGQRVQLGTRTLLKFELHGSIEGQFHQKLYEAGTQDPLTGVYNRRYFEEHFDAEFRLASRHNEELTLVMVDLDFFKEVNDRFGHPAGDKLLRTAAEILRRRLRGEDILARYGGDEFAIVLRRCGEEGAILLVEAILQLGREAQTTYQGQALALSFSVGIATHGKKRTFASAEELVRAADVAIYEAKRAGRGRYALSPR